MDLGSIFLGKEDTIASFISFFFSLFFGLNLSLDCRGTYPPSLEVIY